MSEPAELLHYTLWPVPTALAPMRQAISTWLDAHDWPVNGRRALVHTADESCSLMILGADQPPGPPIEIEGAVCSNDFLRYVVLSIHDHSGGYPTSASDPETLLSLAIMNDAGGDLTIRSTPAGVVVIVTSEPVMMIPRK